MDKKEPKNRINFLSNDVLNELKDIVLPELGRPETTDVKIIFDEKHTRQYSLKIPKKIAEKAQINPEKDVFQFTVIVPSNPNERPTLTATLVRL